MLNISNYFILTQGEGKWIMSASSPSLHCRNRNRIHRIEASQLEPFVALETLDLSSNNITEIRSGCFPVGLHIKDL